MALKELDETGFVFLDGIGRPFLCRLWCGVPWLCYWHPDGHWVTLREVNQMDIWSFPHNLTEEEQQAYHDRQAAWEGRFSLAIAPEREEPTP